jgi:hypothetical protein
VRKHYVGHHELNVFAVICKMTPLKSNKDKGNSRLVRSSSNPSFNGNSSSCESLLSVGASEWSIVATKSVAGTVIRFYFASHAEMFVF